MNLMVDRFAKCPHCGGPLASSQAGPPEREAGPAPDSRWDILELLAEASRDKAFDETTRVRVTQQDIQKLIDKRRKGHK